MHQLLSENIEMGLARAAGDGAVILISLFLFESLVPVAEVLNIDMLPALVLALLAPLPGRSISNVGLTTGGSG